MSKPRRSVRYNRMLKNIPTSKSLKEAALKAGYAESTASHKIYSMVGRLKLDLAACGYSKEAIQAEFERLSAKCEEINDMSNAQRGLENIAKIQGLYKENTNINNAIFNLSHEDSKLIRDKLQAVDSVDVKTTEDTSPIE